MRASQIFENAIRRRCSDARERAAFTLIELLVIVGVIGILFLLMLPALAGTRPGNQAAQCMNNTRQLMRAIQVYAGDNGDLFPPNPDDSNSSIGHSWFMGNSGGNGPWNSSALMDPRRFLLLTYVGNDSRILRCPADHRVGHDIVTGKITHAPRTYSINGAVGTVCAGYKAGGRHSGPPNLPTVAPWLGGPQYERYRNLSMIANPKPSGLWVLLDESPYGLNDGCFAFSMMSPSWVDAPGTYHDDGADFVFADGHSEIHPWKTGTTGKAGVSHVPTDPDFLWMRARTSALTN